MKPAAFKIYTAVILFLAMRALGNASMAAGLKHVPDLISASPVLYISVMAHPLVAVGVISLILSLLARMALLSLADLTYVLPVTAIGYVINVVLGRVFLHETVSYHRWVGTFLIFLGAALVAPAAGNTTAIAEEPAE